MSMILKYLKTKLKNVKYLKTRNKNSSSMLLFNIYFATTLKKLLKVGNSYQFYLYISKLECN